jgi:hypothetical protein
MAKENKIEWYKRYLGIYWNPMREMLLDNKRVIWNKFKEINIDKNSPYFVMSRNKELLGKFIAYYLIKSDVDFDVFDAYEYVRIKNNNKDDDIIEPELMIFYDCGTLESLRGNASDWASGVLLSTLVRRLRNKLKTLVVTESDIPLVRNSSEFNVLNLDEIMRGVKYTKSNYTQDYYTDESADR